MSKVLELKEKRAKAWEAAKAFLDSKQGTNGLMSAEDAATYDRMEAEVVDLGKEIDRLERQAVIDAELAKARQTRTSRKCRQKPLLLRLDRLPVDMSKLRQEIAQRKLFITIGIRVYTSRLLRFRLQRQRLQIQPQLLPVIQQVNSQEVGKDEYCKENRN